MFIMFSLNQAVISKKELDAAIWYEANMMQIK
jgi:hypothetical protein